MKKLGKKNELQESIEAYRGHLFDCTGVDTCHCSDRSQDDQYDENDRLWRVIAW